MEKQVVSQFLVDSRHLAAAELNISAFAGLTAVQGEQLILAEELASILPAFIRTNLSENAMHQLELLHTMKDIIASMETLVGVEEEARRLLVPLGLDVAAATMTK